ncbi:Small RNA 2'-O-methyltransferase OS=Streptomyces fumanus OX=67302 GN=GCM10018772_38830 PE=3 SV=1 [Streptomyces fumanus]
MLYPEAEEAALCAGPGAVVEVDAVALVRRGKGAGRGGARPRLLARYVNDRPYAASSLLAVALGSVFSSALRGVCKARPERAAAPLPLGCRGARAAPAAPPGPPPVRAAGLGSDRQTVLRLVQTHSPWGDSGMLCGSPWSPHTLAEALRHLYVLLPVLDDAKSGSTRTRWTSCCGRARAGCPGRPSRS